MSATAELPTNDVWTSFNFKNTRLERIPIELIRENADALRVTVDKEDANYQMNLQSVKKHGIMLPILVREITDPVSGNTLYGLVDGLHRLNWAMDAGLTDIPANIGSLDEANLLEAQIIANVAKIETKPVQYTKALLKILGQNPLMTVTELASRLSRDTTWVQNRLGLLKLSEDIQKLVDEDRLGLTNAYALSKLPEEKQSELLNQAMSQSPQQFVPMADNIRKELATAKREGRKAEADKFKPNPRLQRLALIKDEQAYLASPETRGNSRILALAKQAGVSTVEDAIAFAMNWALHLDPESLKADEAEWKAEQEKNAAEKQRKKEEAEKKKANKDNTSAGPAGRLIDPREAQKKADEKPAVQTPVLA